MTDCAWPAPAKLNLFLNVVGRRDDGYHLLQTVFQFVNYCDELRFRVRADGRVTLHGGLPGMTAEADLTVRAARLLQRETGCGLGVEIHLQKRIPVGGGLGGGSSDAATTLLVLNRIWDLAVDFDRLSDLALRLGADVPVFVGGQAAWAEQVGERLQPVDLPEPWYLVVVPDVEVATGAVFSAPELTRNSPLKTMSAFLGGECGNDCEKVVFRRYPAVERAAAWLSQFGKARLTGTGACVFTDFLDERAARAAGARLEAAGLRGFVARGLNRSPLHEQLE